MSDPVSWLVQFGVSGGVITLLWRILVFMRPYLERWLPLVEQILHSHLTLVNSVGVIVKDNTTTLNSIKETQGVHTSLLTDIKTTVSAIDGKVKV